MAINLDNVRNLVRNLRDNPQVQEKLHQLPTPAPAPRPDIHEVMPQPRQTIAPRPVFTNPTPEPPPLTVTPDQIVNLQQHFQQRAPVIPIRPTITHPVINAPLQFTPRPVPVMPIPIAPLSFTSPRLALKNAFTTGGDTGGIGSTSQPEPEDEPWVVYQLPDGSKVTAPKSYEPGMPAGSNKLGDDITDATQIQRAKDSPLSYDNAPSSVKNQITPPAPASTANLPDPSTNLPASSNPGGRYLTDIYKQLTQEDRAKLAAAARQKRIDSGEPLDPKDVGTGAGIGATIHNPKPDLERVREDSPIDGPVQGPVPTKPLQGLAPTILGTPEGTLGPVMEGDGGNLYPTGWTPRPLTSTDDLAKLPVAPKGYYWVLPQDDYVPYLVPDGEAQPGGTKLVDDELTNIDPTDVDAPVDVLGLSPSEILDQSIPDYIADGYDFIQQLRKDGLSAAGEVLKFLQDPKDYIANQSDDGLKTLWHNTIETIGKAWNAALPPGVEDVGDFLVTASSFPAEWWMEVQVSTFVKEATGQDLNFAESAINNFGKMFYVFENAANGKGGFGSEFHGGFSNLPGGDIIGTLLNLGAPGDFTAWMIRNQDDVIRVYNEAGGGEAGAQAVQNLYQSDANIVQRALRDTSQDPLTWAAFVGWMAKSGETALRIFRLAPERGPFVRNLARGGELGARGVRIGSQAVEHLTSLGIPEFMKGAEWLGTRTGLTVPHATEVQSIGTEQAETTLGNILRRDRREPRQQPPANPQPPVTEAVPPAGRTIPNPGNVAPNPGQAAPPAGSTVPPEPAAPERPETGTPRPEGEATPPPTTPERPVTATETTGASSTGRYHTAQEVLDDPDVPNRWKPKQPAEGNTPDAITTLYDDAPDTYVQVANDMAPQWREAEEAAGDMGHGEPRIGHAINTSVITHETDAAITRIDPNAPDRNWTESTGNTPAGSTASEPFRDANTVIRDPWTSSKSTGARRRLYGKKLISREPSTVPAAGGRLSASANARLVALNRYVDLVQEHTRWLPDELNTKKFRDDYAKAANIDNLLRERGYRRSNGGYVGRDGLPALANQHVDVTGLAPYTGPNAVIDRFGNEIPGRGSAQTAEQPTSTTPTPRNNTVPEDIRTIDLGDGATIAVSRHPIDDVPRNLRHRFDATATEAYRAQLAKTDVADTYDFWSETENGAIVKARAKADDLGWTSQPATTTPEPARAAPEQPTPTESESSEPSRATSESEPAPEQPTTPEEPEAPTPEPEATVRIPEEPANPKQAKSSSGIPPDATAAATGKASSIPDPTDADAEVWPNEPRTIADLKAERPNISDDAAKRLAAKDRGRNKNLWNTAKGKTTKAEALRFMQESYEQKFGPRADATRKAGKAQGKLPAGRTVYDNTRNGRGWKIADDDMARFGKDWDDVHGPDAAAAPTRKVPLNRIITQEPGSTGKRGSIHGDASKLTTAVHATAGAPRHNLYTTGVIVDAHGNVWHLGRPVTKAEVDVLTRVPFEDGSTILDRHAKYTKYYESEGLLPDEAEIRAANVVSAEYRARLETVYPGSQFAKQAQPLLNAWDTATTFRRQRALYGWTRMVSYPLVQHTGNLFTLLVSGRIDAIAAYPKALMESRRAILEGSAGKPWEVDPLITNYDRINAKLGTRQGNRVRDVYRGVGAGEGDNLLVTQALINRKHPVLAGLSRVLGTRKVAKWGAYSDLAMRQVLGESATLEHLRTVKPQFRAKTIADLERWGVSKAEAIKAWDDLEATTRDGLFDYDDVRNHFESIIGAGRADRIGRDWIEQVRKVEAYANDKMREVAFTGPETRADLAAKRIFLFHHFFARQSWFYVSRMMQHPFMLHMYFEAKDALEDMAEGWPDYMQNWVKLVFGSPYGYQLFWNPTGLASTWLTFQDQGSGFVDDKMSRGGKWLDQITNTLGVNPIILDAANLFGYLGNYRSPDVLGLFRESDAVTVGINLGRAYGLIGDDPTPIGNLNTDINTWLREKFSGLFPDSEKIDFVPSSQGFDRQVQFLLLDEADRMGLDWNDPDDQKIILDAMNDPDSVLYQKAIKRYVNGETARVLYQNLGTPFRFRMRSINAEGEDLYGNLDQDQKNIGNTIDPESRALKTQADQYYGLGGDKEAAMGKVYTQIMQASMLDPFTVDGVTYTPEQVQAMDKDQRKALADAMLNDYELLDDYDTYRQQQDDWLTEEDHKEFATYKRWQSEVYDYEGGPDAYWDDLIAENRNAARWHATLPEGQSEQARNKSLTNIYAYMAMSGIQPDAFDPEPIVTSRNASGVYDPVNIGQNAPTADEPYVSEYEQTLRKDVPGYFDKIETWDAATEEKASELGYPDVPFNDLSTKQRKNVEDTLEDEGVYEPKIPYEVLDYVEWAEQQPAGADTSIDAFLAADAADYRLKAPDRLKQKLKPKPAPDDMWDAILDLLNEHDYTRYP